MKTIILLIVSIILYCSFPHVLLSQVTMGSDVSPQKSALLELKDYEPDVNNTTSTRGFLMSRVKLTSLTSLNPVLSDDEVTEDDKKNNIGLQVYHVGGNEIPAGVKVWSGISWSGLDNSTTLLANNGISYNSDTIQLGGNLIKPTQLIGSVSGANLEYTSTQANMLITGGAKLGVNTSTPETSVDINGDLAIRHVPVLEDGYFTNIGVDEQGKIYKRNDSFTSYSIYLGFEPMAKTHTDTIPLTLQEGYIYKMEGVAIGSCQGILVYFTITFVGTRYVGATLQAVATKEGNTEIFNPVVFSASQSIFDVNESLEYLAGKTSCGSSAGGHFLSYLTDTNQIVVKFWDYSPFFKDAGTFAVTNLVQLSIVGADQVVE